MDNIPSGGLFNTDDEYRKLYELLKRRINQFEFYNEHRKSLCKKYDCMYEFNHDLCIHKHILVKKLCKLVNILLILIINYSERENVKICKNILENKVKYFGEIGLKIAKIWSFTIFNNNIEVNHKDRGINIVSFINTRYYDKKSLKLIKLYKSYQQKKSLIKYFIKILPRIESIHYHNTNAIDIGELIEISFLRLIYDEYTDACYKRT